jgi:hypothetical protein
MLLVTTLPAPMVLPSPTVTPGQMIAPPPIHTSSPMVTGEALSTSVRRASGSKGWCAVALPQNPLILKHY